MTATPTAKRLTPTDALDLVGLRALMQRCAGSAAVAVALVDGPVAPDHPDLAGVAWRRMGPHAACAAGGLACEHGTLIARILFAPRDAAAPGICPGCSPVTRPIFRDADTPGFAMPRAGAAELAAAIVETVEAGAAVVNVSAAVVGHSARYERVLAGAIDEAARRDVLVVCSAGNGGTVGGSLLARHPWVVPVVAYDLAGRPMEMSDLGAAAGRRGVGAPGEGVSGGARGFAPRGTSIAAAFVSGAAALLRSAHPRASAQDVRRALAASRGSRGSSVVPALFDAEQASVRLRAAGL
jgi:subtilisin family serine protease